MPSRNETSLLSLGKNPYRLVSVVVAYAVAALSLLVVIAWIVDIPSLEVLLDSAATMKANTALGLALAGISIAIGGPQSHTAARKVALALALAAGLIGGLTLAEYATGADFGIDQLLAADYPQEPTAIPGRMAPISTITLLLLAASAVGVQRGKVTLGQLCAIATCFIALLAIIGYVYDVESLRRIGSYSSTALQAALGFFGLGVASLLARPDEAVMGIVTSATAGGVLARRLLIPAVVTPIVLGWIRLQGQRLGLYDTEFGLSLMVLSMIVFLWISILWNARGLYMMEMRRLQLEDQLRQGQKMDAIGQLAGGVAHDFNNLLTAILGYADLILSSLGANDPMRLRVLEIEKAGNRAASLTAQLLAFSRRQILQSSRVDINAMVLEVHNLLTRIIGEDVELIHRLGPDIWPLRADRGQLERVVMNLVVNARDAMPNGGKITIETSNVMLDETYTSEHFESRPGPHVMLAVSDTGSGMDRETQRHVFEPFFTTKEQGKGTGLGLATVYGIVKQSQGTIWLYSEPGKGTTFKIYLPRDESAPVVAGSRLFEPAPTMKGRTILLVEDDELVRKLARAILERGGHNVIDASNPSEALEFCKKTAERIDLLITDVVMPGMNGKQLSEKVVALRPDAKVLFMSGYTDAGIVDHGELEPDTDFIQKPFSPDALLMRVYAVLNKDVI